MTTPVQKGTTALQTFETLDREYGSRVAPAELPTVEYVHVNGVVNSAIVPTIAVMQDSTPADIVGYYKVTFSTASLNRFDIVHVAVTATILGVISRKVFQFQIKDDPSQIPVIQ